MKDRNLAVVVVILVLLQVFSIIRISNLQSDLRYETQNYHSELEQLRDEISSIYNNVDNILEEQASIIKNFEFDFLKFDEEAMAVPVHFELTPKTLADDTKVSLDIEGDIYEMHRDEMTFSATVPIGATDTVYPSVIIESQGIKQLQDLDGGRIDMLYYVFPEALFPSFGGRINTSSGFCHIEGDIVFDALISDIGNYIDSATYVIKIDDKTVLENPIARADEQITIDKESSHAEKYLFEKVQLFEVVIDEEIPAENGQTITIYVNATDNLGFVHEHLAYHYVIAGSAQREPAFHERKIYSPSGELVYQTE